MSEETAARADAGTEMVFKASSVMGILCATLIGLVVALRAGIILAFGPRPYNVFMFVLTACFFTVLCLELWKYELRLSAGTLTYQRLGIKRVISAAEVRSARWSWLQTLHVTHDSQGRILHTKVRCGMMRSQDRRWLVSALREVWPDVFPE